MLVCSRLSDEEGYVDLEEFLEMIRLLKLAHIDNDAKRELYKMYRRVCNDEGTCVVPRIVATMLLFFSSCGLRLIVNRCCYRSRTALP